MDKLYGDVVTECESPSISNSPIETVMYINIYNNNNRKEEEKNQQMIIMEGKKREKTVRHKLRYQKCT